MKENTGRIIFQNFSYIVRPFYFFTFCQKWRKIKITKKVIMTLGVGIPSRNSQTLRLTTNIHFLTQFPIPMKRIYEMSIFFSLRKLISTKKKTARVFFEIFSVQTPLNIPNFSDGVALVVFQEKRQIFVFFLGTFFSWHPFF